MPTESRAAKQARAKRILDLLARAYPDAKIALEFRTPFELLVATILSAQCTDERVNMVTPALFRRYPTARELARARTPSLEKEIRSTGFFRAKARSLLGMSKALVERHGGAVPETLEALVELPGVGLKTANVIIGNAFGGQALAVDTHLLITHGRRTCLARKPACPVCPVRTLCPWPHKTGAPAGRAPARRA